jgi:hypothetical protein
VKRWIGVTAAPETMDRLATLWPDLEIEPDGEAWLATHPSFAQHDVKDLHGLSKQFALTAHTLLALHDPSTAPLCERGVIVHEGDGHRSHVLLAELPSYEVSSGPVAFYARGTTGPPSRSFGVRALELAARNERFRRAGDYLLRANNDFREIFMALELIEKAHQKPQAKARPSEWAAFYKRMEVDADDWKALRRSVRPARHAEPHEDGGRKMGPALARTYVIHALKLWVEHEVPD